MFKQPKWNIGNISKHAQILIFSETYYEYWFVNVFLVFRHDKRLFFTKAIVLDMQNLLKLFSEEMVNKLFSMADRLQKIGLTYEELHILMAMSVVSPDRCVPLKDIEGVAAIHGVLVEAMMYSLKQSHQSKYTQAFARVVSFCTELRTLGNMNDKDDILSTISTMEDKSRQVQGVTTLFQELHRKAQGKEMYSDTSKVIPIPYCLGPLGEGPCEWLAPDPRTLEANPLAELFSNPMPGTVSVYYGSLGHSSQDEVEYCNQLLQNLASISTSGDEPDSVHAQTQTGEDNDQMKLHDITARSGINSTLQNRRDTHAGSIVGHNSASGHTSHLTNKSLLYRIMTNETSIHIVNDPTYVLYDPF